MFARRNAMANACAIVAGHSGNTIENVNVAIDALSYVLINGVEESEMRDVIYFLKMLMDVKGLAIVDHGGPITSRDVRLVVVSAMEMQTAENKQKACARIGDYIKQGGLHRLDESVANLGYLYN